jgi:hypothetical protein
MPVRQIGASSLGTHLGARLGSACFEAKAGDEGFVAGRAPAPSPSPAEGASCLRWVRYLRRSGNESPAPMLKPWFFTSAPETIFASPSV